MSARLLDRHSELFDTVSGILDDLSDRLSGREEYSRSAFYHDLSWLIRELYYAGVPWFRAAKNPWLKWATDLEVRANELEGVGPQIALPSDYSRSDREVLRDVQTLFSFISYMHGQVMVEFWDRDRDIEGNKHTYSECVKLTFRVADWLSDHDLKYSEHMAWLKVARNELFDLFRALGEQTHSGSLGTVGDMPDKPPWSSA